MLRVVRDRLTHKIEIFIDRAIPKEDCLQLIRKFKELMKLEIFWEMEKKKQK